MEWSGKIILVGMSDLASTIGMCLDLLGKDVVGVCDNNSDLQHFKLMNMPIMSVSDAANSYVGALYVICTFSIQNVQTLIGQLTAMGIEQIVDGKEIFAYYQSNILKRQLVLQDVLRLYEQMQKKEGIVLYDVPISITSYCTLNCKNCSFMIPHRECKKHNNIISLSNDIRCLSETVDVIKSLNIIGGEAFTYMQGLVDLLNLVAETRNIMQIKIVTNGTVVPEIEDLKEIKKYVSCIEISDYGNVSRKKDELCEVLKLVGIPFRIIPETRMWYQIDEFKLYDRKEEELQHLFETCGFFNKDKGAECTPLYRGMLHRCAIQAYGIDIAGTEMLNAQDAVVIRDMESMELRELIQNMLECKEQLQFCKYCGVRSDKLVLPGEQCES